MKARKEMSFLDHMEDLRWHLIRAALSVVVFFFLALYFTPQIFEHIIFAPGRLDFVTFRWLCQLGEFLQMDKLCVSSIPMKIQSRYLMGQFTMQLTASIVIGIIASFPYIIWESWRFIKPGLYGAERSQSRGIVLSSSFLFLLGVCFGYFIMCPMSIAFLANYSISDLISNEFDITSYVSTVAVLVLGCGFLFQLPMAVFFLTRVGLLSPQFMQRYRKHSVIAILFIGALLTPSSDPFTLSLIALPLYVLFEISILISAAEMKRKQKKMRQTQP